MNIGIHKDKGMKNLTAAFKHITFLAWSKLRNK